MNKKSIDGDIIIFVSVTIWLILLIIVLAVT